MFLDDISFIGVIVDFLSNILSLKIFEIPIVVLWVLSGWLFCTIAFKFINIRLFLDAVKIITNTDSSKKKSGGYINHFQAFTTAIAGTVGIGTISGVAIAISIGGPGAVAWMFVAGFICMSCKFAEVVLSVCYRENSDGIMISGPFQYMRKGLKEKGYPTIGKYISVIYSILMIIALSSGIAFQTNQSVVLAQGYSSFIDENLWIVGTLFTIAVALIIVGGLKRIASFVSKVVPLMVIVHVLSCVIIITINSDKLIYTLNMIFGSMFSLDAAFGGSIMSAMIIGVRRAIFASEAGIGTAAIAHSATQDSSPVRSGLSAMLAPCIDTMLVCVLTGVSILIITEGELQSDGIIGVRIAFSTVSPIFSWCVSVVTPLFGFSTIIAYSYYCELSWSYLLKSKIILMRFITLLVVFCSSIASDVLSIAAMSDIMFMCLTIPNMLVIYVLYDKVNYHIKLYEYSRN